MENVSRVEKTVSLSDSLLEEKGTEPFSPSIGTTGKREKGDSSSNEDSLWGRINGPLLPYRSRGKTKVLRTAGATWGDFGSERLKEGD